MSIIEMQRVTKDFGNGRGIFDVNLQVSKGHVMGFLGPNGAGKTTTIKSCCGILQFDEGEILIDGKPLVETSPADAIERGVQVIYQDFSLFPNLTVAENLDIHRRLTGAARSSVAEAIGRLRLDDYADRRAGRLSLGNKQRLSLARALLHAPELLILDEPANGLDPAGIVEVRELLRELAASGVTVFMSSHLLAEVAHLADRIGIVDAGRLVEEASRHELATRARAYVRDAFTEAERAEALITADLERYFLARTAPSERPVR